MTSQYGLAIALATTKLKILFAASLFSELIPCLTAFFGACFTFGNLGCWHYCSDAP
jgi:hypothetical protein